MDAHEASVAPVQEAAEPNQAHDEQNEQQRHDVHALYVHDVYLQQNHRLHVYDVNTRLSPSYIFAHT